MNQTQRKYLVDKITERTKLKIQQLKDSKPERYNLNAYMLHKVLQNDFELKSTEELKEYVRQQAVKVGLNKDVREDWLGNHWGGATKAGVHMSINDFFVIPDEYKLEVDRINNEINEIDQKIRFLQNQLENLELRIMLASDSTLRKLINEIDDMGDITLINTQIKHLE